MGKRFYKFVTASVRLFSHRVRTEWEEPFEEGPCVFVVNHVGVTGPVDMCSKFPQRDKLHLWINEEMLDAKKVPAYVRKDYWWKPDGFFAPLLNVTVPYLAALFMPPMLKSVQHVTVYHDQRIMLTLRESIRVLQKGHYLLLFPEQPGGRRSPGRRINTGWLRLGELWYRNNGRTLRIYPVHVDNKKHLIRVAAPVYYDPARRFSEQEKELAEKLTKGIRGE